MKPDRKALISAHELVKPHIHRTPVLTSRLLDEMTGAELYFKCDNLQKGGAYKIRGATHAVLNLTDEQRQRGICTHSSGNFAQAISIAARAVGAKAYIVMPESTPDVKIAATKGYGAEVIMCPSTLEDRIATIKKVKGRTGATQIHSSNDMDVIIGQSTMTKELIEQVEDTLDYVLVPMGGGGVSAGACLAVHHFSPDTEVIGAEPATSDDAFRSLRDGVIHPAIPNTICDGLRTQLGDVNFPIIQEMMKEIILVDDQVTIRAMKTIWERMKVIVEPSSAITLAVVLDNPEYFKGKKVGLIITGGNVNLDDLPW